MGNVTSGVAAKFAFFPPDPPTYDVSKDEGGKLVFSGVSGDKNMDVHLVETKGGNKVVATFWKHPFARFTILYSHGNAADLGQMHELFIELRAHLRVNIMSYDYSGYGASSGKPSEFNTYHDIEAVYNCLKSEYGVKQEDLILYGQSVGSGPTLHMASRLKRLRAVVLHSAILSGIRVLYNIKVTFWFDIFKNIDKIRHVTCPVLVIHVELGIDPTRDGFYFLVKYESLETNWEQKMTLLICPMGSVYGNLPRKNMTPYGSRAEAIAT
ncbi:hypothetical protein ABKV19_002215 [Rosa sericea]